jgi:hypothetical protein
MNVTGKKYTPLGYQQMLTLTGVTSITSVGTLATCTMDAAHGLLTGDSVTIADAVEGDYNGSFTATVTGATTFTYTMLADPTSPATGTPTMASGRRLTIPNGARYAEISAGSTAARMRDDGSAPTATDGLPIPVGAAPLWYAGKLSALQFYQSTGGSNVNVAYYA